MSFMAAIILPVLYSSAAHPSEMKSRAVIIGGSLGGLFAANLRADLGWEVDVFERVPDDLASRGAGIGTHEELVAMLANLGIGMDGRPGTKAGDRICVDRAGTEA